MLEAFKEEVVTFSLGTGDLGKRHHWSARTMQIIGLVWVTYLSSIVKCDVKFQAPTHSKSLCADELRISKCECFGFRPHTEQFFNHMSQIVFYVPPGCRTNSHRSFILCCFVETIYQRRVNSLALTSVLVRFNQSLYFIS